MLVTKSQVAGALEGAEGLERVLDETNVHEVVNRDFPSAAVNAPTVERKLASGSAGTKPGLVGGRDGSLQLLMEMAPPVTPGAEPFWSRYLRCSGMNYAQTKKQAIAGSWTSGTVIPHGATFFTDVTFARGLVVGTYYEGEDLFVRYEPRPQASSTAVGASDTKMTFSLHGQTVAVVPLSSPGVLTSGQAWHPTAQALSQILLASATSTINLGDELLGATSGARARCANDSGVDGAFLLRLDMYNGSPVFVAGETINVVGGGVSAVVAAGVTQTQRAVPTLTVHTLNDGRRSKLKGVRGSWSLLLPNMEQGIFTFDLKGVPLQPDDDLMFDFTNRLGPPPRITGSSFLIDGTFAPSYSQVQINSNTVVNMREDPSDVSLSGYLAAEVTDYAHDLTIDPEAVQEAIYPWWAKQFDKTSMRTKHVIGSGVGTTFEIRQDHLQLESLAHSERNERLTKAATLKATSGDDLVGGGETCLFLD